MSYIERKIDVAFNFAQGKTGEDFGPTELYKGLRCEASINNLGGESLNSLQFRCFGMNESSMNKLSTMGMRITILRRNVITLFASDHTGAMIQVFQGTISEAWIDYRSAPDVSLNVIATAGYFEKLKPAAVNSYKGPTDVATIIESLAKSIGFAFQNNGVTAKLASPYFAGSAVTQMKECAQHANISIDIDNGMVKIWPGNTRVDDVSFLVSPETGLVGYPVFSSLGITVQTLFNPDLIRGRRIEVKSSLPQACRQDWYVQTVRHELSSQTPNGPWFSICELAGEGVRNVYR